MPASQAEPLLVLDALHSTPARRYLSAEPIPDEVIWAILDAAGLPEDAMTMALLPLGYPARGRWAQPKRRPVEQVVHWNQWGGTRPRP